MALNNIPQAGQSLGSTRDLISQNFSVIDTAFSINHVPYNDPSGLQGKHPLVQFPVQTTIPATITTGDISLYNKLPAAPFPTTGTNELFLVKANGTTTIPITASHQATTGWTYLPSGILMKWGVTTTISGGSPFAYLYPTGASIPAFSNVFTVMLTPIDSTSGGAPITDQVSVETGTIATTGFSVVYQGTAYSTTVVQYFAIGN
jgi:hypothetical protein